MTELNPAAEAERLAKLAAAEGAQIGDILKTDAGTVETDVKADVEKALAAVKPAEATVQTAAATVAAGGVQETLTAIKTNATRIATPVDAAAACASLAASEAIQHLEAPEGFISAELNEAKLKLKSALSWIEAHFTTKKATPPAPPPHPLRRRPDLAAVRSVPALRPTDPVNTMEYPMTEPTTNPDAEAAAIAAAKLKQPPPIPQATTAAQAAAAAPVLTVNPANIAAAIASIEAAQKSISTAGNVTGDLQLAQTGCATALKWLNVANAKAAAAAPKV